MTEGNFKIHDLASLLNTKTKCAVSIYIPTHTSGRDVREDHIELKDQLRDVTKKLSKEMNEQERKVFLKPAWDLVEDIRFWDDMLQGLAIFIGDNFFKYFKLPIDVKAENVVDPQFYIEPLIPLITEDGTYYVLAVSEAYAKLFKGTRFTFEEVHVPDMPESMKDALWYKNFQTDQLEGESGKIRAKERNAIPFWMDKHKKYVVEYLRQANEAICKVLASKRDPLILAAAKGLPHLYQEANTYHTLLDNHIETDPLHISLEQLHDKSWHIFAAEIESAKQQIIDSYKDLIGSHRFVTDIQEIIAASFDGLVEALFLQKEMHLWGNYDHDKRMIKLEKNDNAKNFDLLNLALTQTITKKGQAYVLPSEKMPSSAQAVAILRYDYTPPINV